MRKVNRAQQTCGTTSSGPYTHTQVSEEERENNVPNLSKDMNL